MALAFPALPLSRFRLQFSAPEPVLLPEYAGSAWRGAFGHALKRLVCVTREPDCRACLLLRSCVYPYVFETPPDPAAGKLRKYPAAPHPYVLRPLSHGRLAAGSEAWLELLLFGRGHDTLPYVLRALEQAGQRGLGKGRGRLELHRVEQAAGDEWLQIWDGEGRLSPRPAEPPVLPDCPPRLRLVLETPLRLKVSNQRVVAERFDFGMLFGNLLRRISLLMTFHTDTELEADFAGLSRAARQVTLGERSLFWREWTRYSSRQDGAVPMGGLLGWIELDGERMTPYWPYLWLGQWTHAGQGAVMGLGRYRVQVD